MILIHFQSVNLLRRLIHFKNPKHIIVKIHKITLPTTSCDGKFWHGFYYFSGKSKRLEANNQSNLNSNAKNIQVTQTDEQGQLYAKSTIQGMTLNMQTGDAVLEQLKGVHVAKANVLITMLKLALSPYQAMPF